ncbi:MAG: acyl-CoA thioesterase [Bacteroidales bacterium]
MKTNTSQSRAIFPVHLNDNNSLFGGIAMKWMDEVAYITASRFTRKKMVTVTVEKVNYLKPVQVGDFIEITGRVIKSGNVKLKVEVTISRENFKTGELETAISAHFVMASVDETGMPVRL